MLERKNNMNNKEYDYTKNRKIGYDIIVKEIRQGTKVLDLGCSNGLLLEILKQEKNIKGFGVEISEEGVSASLEKGLYCYQGDIDEGLTDYKDNSFDYVILNQTLQSTKMPHLVLAEIMRISKFSIVSFPNFGHYITRLYLLLKGKMPMDSKFLPYKWYQSPNIHHLTIADFHEFCTEHNFTIMKEFHFSIKGEKTVANRLMPNLFAQYGFFILDGRKITSDNL